MSVSENQVLVLTYCEQKWWENGAIPSDEKIANALGLSVATVKSYFKKEKFREALQRRGVILHNAEDPAAAVLSLNQLTVASMLLNIHDKRSMREKLKELDVSTQQLNSWMRDPKFAGYIRRRAEQQFASADATAYLSVLKNMEAGDLNATRLFLEMRQIYTPKVNVQVDVDMVLTNVIEIIAKHVTDRDTLIAIANDIEKIDGVRSKQSELDSGIVDAEVVEESEQEIRF